MDEEKLKKAADLLKEASDMLLTVETSTSTCSGTDSSDSSTMRPAITTPIAETLSRARSMMNRSSSRGLYRRLNRNERLRATAESATKNKTAKKTKNIEKRPFEFALLRANSEESDEEDEVETLKKERIPIVERGMVVLNEDDSELCVRGKIVSSLKSEYGLKGPNDFDFVKVTQKKISVLRLAEGTEYNYSVVKELAGQGLLYIRMKKAYNFVLNESDSGQDQSDWLYEDLLESHRPAQRPTSTTTCHDQTGEFTGTSTSTNTSTRQTEEPTITTDPQRDKSLTCQTQ